MTVDKSSVDLLVQKVSKCLNLQEKYTHVDISVQDACIRKEILALVEQESINWMTSLELLAKRIDASLGAVHGKRGKKNKREELKMSKLDEWYLVQQHLAKEEHEKEKEQEKQRRQHMVECQQKRKEHLLEASRKKKEEKRRKKEECIRLKEEVRRAKEDDEKAKLQQRLRANQLKNDRQAQIELEREKKSIATTLKSLVDEKEKKSIADALKKEQQMRRTAKMQAVKELESVYQENKQLQRKKKEEKEAEKEESKRCMEEYTRMLLKQEDERRMQLKKIQEIQDRQEMISMSNSTCTKRWIDDALVEKQAKENDMKYMAESKAKTEKKARANEECIEILNRQVQEKLERQKEQAQMKESERLKLAGMKKESNIKQHLAIQKATDACIKLKEGLDTQIREQRKAKMSRIGMNSMERRLNAKILRKALAQER
ncbi:hypothetical protein M9434_003637 [Picochlorum sp. BPE23]|nr:hypothetical protein M9434_003637 [Picochlorum sp. BPE23]